MRYFDLDENGHVLSASRWAHADWIKLPEQPSEYHFWDGEQWVEDTALKNQSRINGLKQIALNEARKRIEEDIATEVLEDIEQGRLPNEEAIRNSNKYKRIV